MKVDIKDVMLILDEKYLLAEKRKNYDIMTLIADVKNQIFLSCQNN